MNCKYHLALSYFPDSTPDTAMRRLRRWINSCAGLCEALAKTGYRPTQHHFNARQTQLIYEHLGEP